MSIRETRFLTSHELRAVGGSGDSDPLRIEGYASVFNTFAQLPGFQERMKPGAFSRAINEKQDVVCLFNHDSNFVLGRTTSGTLRMSQDAKGLNYVCDLPNTQMARDLHESIKRGDINGCSFAFTVPDGGQEWSEGRSEDGSYFVQRDISDVNLHDVSPVTYPCYSGTEVQARTIEVPMELRSAVDEKNKTVRYSPDQPRDDHGRFGEGDSSASKSDAKNAGNAKTSDEHKAAAEYHRDQAAQAKSDYGKQMHSLAAEAHDKAATAHSDSEKLKNDPAAQKAYQRVVKAFESSANDASQHLAELGNTDDIRSLVSPFFIEKRPYSTVADVPDSVPAAHKKQWMEVWNSVYDKAVKDGKSAKDAESSAFAQANGVIKDAKAAPNASEKRGDDAAGANGICIEDCLAAIACAVNEKYPALADNAGAMCWPGGRFYVCETYENPDAVVVTECATGDNFRIPYTMDDEANVVVGEPQPIEQTWVLSDRGKKRLEEFRTKYPVQKRDEEDDDEEDLQDAFDLGLIGRDYNDDDESDNHQDFGECEDGDCACQNNFCPTNAWEEASKTLTDEQRAACLEAKANAEKRGGMTRTKRVAGKNLTAGSFAYVGDPNKTETWKFPIMDAAHVRNALARWGQAKGIPEGSKAGVLAKIHAAAKKFGIDVAGEQKAREEAAEWRENAVKELIRIGVVDAPWGVFNQRYSPDQPRDDHGRFGESDSGSDKGAGAAHTAASHDAAKATHFAASHMHQAEADKAAQAGNMVKAGQHINAAIAHANAAMEHGWAAQAQEKGSKNKERDSNRADKATKLAREATAKAEAS